MSHKLTKPYTSEQRVDFVVKYNHDQMMTIHETEIALYALEEWELLEGDTVIDNMEEWIQAKEQAEAERIGNLKLTGSDVERGIYKAKGMDFNDILAYVTQLQPEGLDIKALGIELKANNFYRGNPYVDAVGTLLGFTKEQLDKFFEFNDYTYLLPSEPVENTSEQVTEQVEETEDENTTYTES